MITYRDSFVVFIHDLVQNQISEVGNPLNMPYENKWFIFQCEKTGLFSLEN